MASEVDWLTVIGHVGRYGTRLAGNVKDDHRLPFTVTQDVTVNR